MVAPNRNYSAKISYHGKDRQFAQAMGLDDGGLVSPRISDLVNDMRARQADSPVTSENFPGTDMRQIAPPMDFLEKGVPLPRTRDPGTMPSRNISRRDDVDGGPSLPNILNEERMAQDLDKAAARDFGGKMRNAVLHPNRRDLSREAGVDDIKSTEE